MYLSKQAHDTSSSFFIIKPLNINVKVYPWGWAVITPDRRHRASKRLIYGQMILSIFS